MTFPFVLFLLTGSVNVAILALFAHSPEPDFLFWLGIYIWLNWKSIELIGIAATAKERRVA
jgi:hypothetical protein